MLPVLRLPALSPAFSWAAWKQSFCGDQGLSFSDPRRGDLPLEGGVGLMCSPPPSSGGSRSPANVLKVSLALMGVDVLKRKRESEHIPVFGRRSKEQATSRYHSGFICLNLHPSNPTFQCWIMLIGLCINEKETTSAVHLFLVIFGNIKLLAISGQFWQLVAASGSLGCLG